MKDRDPDPIVGACDKCGGPVRRSNDRTELQLESYPSLDHLGPQPHRHLLPEDGCEGSPSWAQYLPDELRDPRDRYLPEREPIVRSAHARIVAAARGCAFCGGYIPVPDDTERTHCSDWCALWDGQFCAFVADVTKAAAGALAPLAGALLVLCLAGCNVAQAGAVGGWSAVAVLGLLLVLQTARRARPALRYQAMACIPRQSDGSEPCCPLPT